MFVSLELECIQEFYFIFCFKEKNLKKIFKKFNLKKLDQTKLELLN